jgi:murein DD-endopeptidase MepM/ murein hydrolase activator NlpD
MDDLLRNTRRRRFSRRRSRWKAWLIGLLAVGAVAAGWFLWPESDGPDKAQLAQEAAMHEATLGVRESVKAARMPLEIEQVDQDFDESAEDPALTANWSEGEQVTVRGKIQKNQSVFLALQERNLEPAAIHKVVSATGEEFNFRRSRPGDEWTAEVDSDGTISKFTYQTSPEDIWETTLVGEGEYEAEKVEVPVERKQTVIAGVVSSSLWKAIEDLGEDGSLIYRFADMFAYSVDFNAETQPGDKFAMVFEKVYLDGEFLRYGKILAGKYKGMSGDHYGFYYEADNGDTGFYDENGENLQRQFLKSPLASVRVTSTYGKRFHPVLGRMKMHHGVDYGAPIGTPIQSVADGTVRFAGWKGANGRLIIIDHANGYRTLYAHLSKIEKGIRPGKRVTKKTVIGRVGNSGRSTGPHLHFGMKRHGKYVNPRKVDFARAEPLKGEERDKYIEEVVEPLKEQLDEAQNDEPAPLAQPDGPSISPG